MSERSAFYPAVPSHAPAHSAGSSSACYITSPPIAPISVKPDTAAATADDDDEQPLDFSIKKEKPCDFSAKAPVAHQNNMADQHGDSDETPMDLSVKPPQRDGATVSRTVARAGVSSSSMSSSSSSQFLSSMSSALQPISVRAQACTATGTSGTSRVSRSDGDGAAANANSPGAGTPSRLDPSDASVSPFVAPFTPPSRTPMHDNLQHCYVAALGKFQCPLCCLLFKNSRKV